MAVLDCEKIGHWGEGGVDGDALRRRGGGIELAEIYISGVQEYMTGPGCTYVDLLLSVVFAWSGPPPIELWAT